MASFVDVDRGGTDGDDWDEQAGGLYAGALLTHSINATLRSGVVLAGDSPLAYVPATGQMKGFLIPGTYMMTAADPARGAIPMTLSATIVLDHDASDNVQPRIDLICAVYSGQGTNGTFKRFQVVKGNPGQGMPSLPLGLGNGRAEVLHMVLIPPNTSELGAITDMRVYTAAAGGMIPVRNSTAGVPIGTPYFDMVTSRPGVIRANGPAPLALGNDQWNGVAKYANVGSEFSVRNYTLLTTSFMSFQLGGGWCVIRATIDAQLKGCGAFYARFSGDDPSEDVNFDDFAGNVRRPLHLYAMRWMPPGPFTNSIDVKSFTGSVIVNSIRYSIYSTGTVS